MSEHTKKHPIKAHAQSDTFILNYHHKVYAIPKNVADQYVIERSNTKVTKQKEENVESIFAKLEKKYTKAGVLLKGLRLRENLTQVEFAKKIKVTQANLSNMENGKRPIGKMIAKRIEKLFGTNYRYFLE